MGHHRRHATRLPSPLRMALAVEAAIVLASGLWRCTWSPSPSEPSKPHPAFTAQHHAGPAAHVPTPATVAASPPARPKSGATAAAVANARAATLERGAPPARHPAAAPTSLRMLPPHAPPQIYGVSVSPTDVGAGDVVSGTVTTSSNVASVVAMVAGTSAGVPKVGVGQFAMSYRLPPFIPPFVKGSYTIVVVARNVDGAATSRSVAITLH